MKDDEVEVGDCFVVFCLENILVNVELKSVVPVIRVWEVLDGGVGGEFVAAVGFHDFTAAFPVVDGEGGVRRGFRPPTAGVLYDFIHHID